MTLVYMLAASHSGSTLTSMLIGAHREVCTVGELKLPSSAMGDMDRYLCSCGRRLLECSFWCGVRERLERQGVPFDLCNAGTGFRETKSPFAGRLLRPLVGGVVRELMRDVGLWCSPTWRKELAMIQRRNVALVSAVAEGAGKRIVVDSSKLAHRLKFLLRNPALEIKVVHLVRDGRGVALTYMNPGRFADAKDASKRGTPDGAWMTMTQAATAWRRSCEEACHILSRVDRSQWLRMRYEDLCRNPAGALSRVFEFIGVDPAGGTLDFRSVEQHVIGNGMRLDTSSAIELDERWRDELTAESLAEFACAAGGMNRKLGYE